MSHSSLLVHERLVDGTLLLKDAIALLSWFGNVFGFQSIYNGCMFSRQGIVLGVSAMKVQQEEAARFAATYRTRNYYAEHPYLRALAAGQTSLRA